MTGDSARPEARGGRIRSVRPCSPAARAGLLPKDRLLAVGRKTVRDVIDVQFYTAEPELDLTIERAGKRMTVAVERSYEDGDLGLEFEHPLFDGVRKCRNRCGFCFVSQLPKGLRKSLYVRDDDYRLSFLSGSYVTLTNLEEADWRRIRDQHLSPLRVSVHATDPALRARLLGIHDDADVLAQLKRLGRWGIEVHAQVVIVPGVNDGSVLTRTLDDLRKLASTVRSVSVIPVGLTLYCKPTLRPVTGAEARAILKMVRERQTACRREMGISWVYPSDELLLIAGARIPARVRYDGYPQFENGVGLVRWFLDDWARTERWLKASSAGVGIIGTMVTGAAFAYELCGCMCSLNALLGCELELLEVENVWLGESINVAGLLSGADVLEAASGAALGECVFLPRAMLDAEGKLTLDGISIGELERRMGARVVPVATMSEVVQYMLDSDWAIC